MTGVQSNDSDIYFSSWNLSTSTYRKDNSSAYKQLCLHWQVRAHELIAQSLTAHDEQLSVKTDATDVGE